MELINLHWAYLEDQPFVTQTSHNGPLPPVVSGHEYMYWIRESFERYRSLSLYGLLLTTALEAEGYP
jgi:hypothetical protein